MTDIPHFTLPFKFRAFGGGQIVAAVAEQDSEDDIFSCVELVLRYKRGFRLTLPTFGVTDQIFFSPDFDKDKIIEEINEWESRADLSVEHIDDTVDELIHRILFTVSSRSEDSGTEPHEEV